MMKYLFVILKIGPFLIWNYFKMRKYLKHPERYSAEERYQFGRHIIKKVDWGFKVDFHIEGLEEIAHLDNVVYLGNHQSMFDPLMLIDLFDKRTTFVAKKETADMIYVGKVAKILDVLFMDRQDLRQSLNVMKEVSRRLKEENGRIMIFPEGTRSRDPLLKPLEFKAGAVKPALDAHSTLVPVAIFGSYKVLSSKHRKLRVDVKFCKPISYEEYQDMNTREITTMVEEIIIKQLDLFRPNHQDMVKIMQEVEKAK